MFSQDDFDKYEKSLLDMPDGLLDASEYAKTFALTVDLIDKLPSEDTENNQVAHAHFMMNIANHIHSEKNGKNEVDSIKALDCITSMCFHLVSLFSAMDSVIPDFKDQYINYLRETVLPDMDANFSSIPYWE